MENQRTADGVVTANGIDIHYRLEGDGETTVVLINGVSDDLEAWVFQVEELLPAGYRVLRFDNRGVGQSSKPAGPYSSRMMAADTKGLVDALGITNFHLLGISMGGTIAQEYAIAHGRDLRSLVLADTFAAPGPYCGRLFRSWGQIALQAGMKLLMREMSPWIFSTAFFEEHEDTLAGYEAEMDQVRQPPEAFAAQLGALVDHDATDRLGQIDTPTLVLAADSDILIPPYLSRRLLDGLHNAEWASISGGHGAMWETAPEFNAAVLAFLRRH
jgi:3-oxoadipate enol-lactonase